jgi:hypothetical protein
MAKTAAIILKTLDKHLARPVELRLMGGAALTLVYGLDRATEDADLLMDDQEATFLAEQCNFAEALEKTNAELEPIGLYISHLWGPEQQILTPNWRDACRPATTDVTLEHITLKSLGPIDMILSKMARADAGDLEDMRYLINHERLPKNAILDAIESAQVPEILRDAFEASRRRVQQLLGPELV